MSRNWKGMGRYPHVQARSQDVLTALAAFGPLTAKQVWEKIGGRERKIAMGAVYADLRRLAGPVTTYTEPTVNPDHPVVWHHWNARASGTDMVMFSLNPAYLAQRETEVADLKAMWAL